MEKAFLIGKKTYLRGLEEQDLVNLQKWLCDSEITKLLYQGEQPINLDHIKQEFQSKTNTNNEIVFAIMSKSNNKHIGWAGIYEINWISRNAEVRFFIGDKKYWRKGLATDTVSLLIDYAFNKLNLHRIHGGANIENKGSVKVFKKLKFKQEGIIKEGHFRNGKYYDLVTFGLINKSTNI